MPMTGSGDGRVSQIVAVAPGAARAPLRAAADHRRLRRGGPASPGPTGGVLDRLHRATGVTSPAPRPARSTTTPASPASAPPTTPSSRSAPGSARRPSATPWPRPAWHPSDVDLIVTTSVTGIAAPSLDARLVPAARPAHRTSAASRSSGSAASPAPPGRPASHDLLRGDPDAVAVLLSVELCSLTVQRDDASMANLVASGLFGDGAAAVVMVGERRAAAARPARSARGRLAQPALPGHRAGDGLGRRRQRLPDRAGRRASPERRRGAPRPRRRRPSSATTTSRPATSSRWVAHPGGPKVLRGDGAHPRPAAGAPCGRTWASLAAGRQPVVGLGAARARRHPRRRAAAAPGSPRRAAGDGPGFCSELVLLRW